MPIITCDRRLLLLGVVALVLPILLPVSAHAQASFGQITAHNALVGENDEENTGFRVVVNDVKIEGFPQRLVTLAVTVSDAAGEKIVFEYYQFETTKKTELWDRLVFEFSEETLRNRFAGEFRLWITTSLRGVLQVVTLRRAVLSK